MVFEILSKIKLESMRYIEKNSLQMNINKILFRMKNMFLRYRFLEGFMPTGSQYIGSGVFSGVFVYRRKFSFESTDFDWRISDDVSIYGVFL